MKGGKMKRTLSLMFVTFTMALLFAPVIAFAAEEGAAAASAQGTMDYYTMAVLACGIAIGVAAFGTGIGQGLGLSKAAEGVARNPGASGKITTTLIIGLAMIESLCIYALVVVLIVLFAKPFGF
jgi:F-type H+-transporting ATPase subunit c